MHESSCNASEESAVNSKVTDVLCEASRNQLSVTAFHSESILEMERLTLLDSCNLGGLEDGYEAGRDMMKATSTSS